MGIRSLVKSSIFTSKHIHTPIETFYAPIWKIPNELMLLVFQKLCYDYDDKTILVKGQPNCAWPLLLSAVCSNWRRIMLDNPTLWSIISVTFTKTSKMSKGCTIFLERSKTAPLIIYLRLPSSLPSGKTIRHPAFQALVNEAPRWKTLYLRGDFGILRINHPMCIVASLPKLETLFLVNSESTETVSNFQLVPMPNLHKVFIPALRAPIDLQSNFPWTQLTSLRLQGLHDVPSLVKLCPNLIDLALILDCRLGEAFPQPPMAIRHKRVQSLSLWLEKDPSSCYVEEPNMLKVMKKVLDMLEFPSLVSLIVRCYQMPPLISHCIAGLAIVDRFIQRSSCTLRKFSIHNIYVFDCLDIFTTILHHNPSIRHLIMHFDSSRSRVAQDIVDLLRPTRSSASPLSAHALQAPPTLLPKLQQVNVFTWKKNCNELQMEEIFHY
ncbi:hypothetical protein BDP27DRAFT_1425525 [Rhodocollybia butyracea]|uniref:F-box domain-containing protein n=1 Tax=Rhodocollybia butyracea TaxID=206335 RepID=A0A9P5PJ12_9AGAR|nr:hypothetical protein BDP27DRAFT_1425525 [Rhodocollybia butyracea]